MAACAICAAASEAGKVPMIFLNRYSASFDHCLLSFACFAGFPLLEGCSSLA